MRKVLLCLFVIVLSSCGDRAKEGEAPLRVKVVCASSDSLSSVVRYAGVVEASSGVSLSFSTSGLLSSLSVSAGSRVSAGSLIGVLDGSVQSDMVQSARSALAMSEESLSQAEDMYARMEVLKAEGSITEVQWVDVCTKLGQARAAVEAAKSQLSIAEKGSGDCRLVSPLNGYVSRVYVDVGENIAVGMPVVEVVDVRKVKACCSVPEGEIGSLSVGDVMTVRVAAVDRVYSGVVSSKGVSADPLSRTYSLEVTLDNAEGLLLPGMLCEVLRDEGSGESVLLPANVVLIDSDNSPFVWLVENGRASKRSVALGGNVGRSVVINSGIVLGDSVVSEGSQKVSSGMCVEAYE